MIAWLAVVLALAATRSAWMDEFYIAHATDPRISLAANYSQSWSWEPHPPTYTFMLWLWRQVVEIENSIFSLRAFGIVVSTLLALGALVHWHKSKWPGLDVFAVLLFSAPTVLFFPQETRSYFLSVFGGVYCSLYFLRAWEHRAPDSPKPADAVVGFVGAALLGTHIISLAFGCLLFGVMGLGMIVMQRWAWLRLTVAISILVLAPTIAVVAVTVFNGLSEALGDFWITRRQLAHTVLELPWFVGAPVALTIALALWKRGEIKERREQAALGLILVIGAVVFALGCVSLIKPMLVSRYLSAPVAGLVPPCAMLITGFMDRHTVSLSRYGRWPAAVVATVLCFAIGLAALNDKVRPRSEWRRPAEALNAVPSCAGSVIPYVILNHPPHPNNIWRKNFEWYAPNHAFKPATPEVVSATSRQACPVRLWIADQFLHFVSDELKAAVHQTCLAGDRVGLGFGSGYLVVDANAVDMIAAWGGRSIPCAEIPLESTGLL
jgi:hypothetical protein